MINNTNVLQKAVRTLLTMTTSFPGIELRLFGTRCLSHLHLHSEQLLPISVSQHAKSARKADIRRVLGRMRNRYFCHRKHPSSVLNSFIKQRRLTGMLSFNSTLRVSYMAVMCR